MVDSNSVAGGAERRDPNAEGGANSNEEESKNEETSSQEEETAEQEQKRKGGRKASVCPRNDGESVEDYKKRQNRVYQARKRALDKAKLKEAKRELMAALNTSKETTDPNEEDKFVALVLGHGNFYKEQIEEKFKSCKAAVCLRLCVKERGWKVHVESKKGQFYEPDKEEGLVFKVQFHTDGQEVTKKLHSEEVHEQPLMDWLRIKKSTIEGAGLGCFADRPFKVGDIIGLYMGSTDSGKGDPGYSMRSFSGLHLHCHSFSNSKSMNEQVTKTMGMQMINDPNYGGTASGKEANVRCFRDMFVAATKAIKKGEEMFMDYQETEYNEDEESQGKRRANKRNKKDAKDGKNGGGESEEEDGGSESSSELA